MADSLGGAVYSAQIVVANSDLRTESNAAGSFRLPRVPAGEIRVQVRRLGYRPSTFVVRVEPGRETEVNFRLAALPELLPPVEVTRRPDISDRRLAGFHARKERGTGHFITRDYIDRHDSPRLADILRRVPGLSVRPLRRGGGGTTVSMRGSCPPLVFLDGFPAAAGALDLDIIDLASVEAIEIYSGISTVPAEFHSVRGGERCGVIAVWSRPARVRRTRLGSAKSGELEREVASQRVYTADRVDQPAILAPGTVEPAFPDSLWRAGVGGRVVAEFIVGTDGSIEPGSFGIASTTHPYFSASVKAALEGAIFRAARLAGRNVRQLVQVPFVFDLPPVPAAGQINPF
ncbi:MAG: TonB-dependent receptor plug domain-containing protein [Gemmatimonadaceae bacterium]